MAKVESVVCDLCGEPASAQVGVADEESAFQLDMCVSCVTQWVEPLREVGRPWTPKRAYHRFKVTELPVQPREKVSSSP